MKKGHTKVSILVFVFFLVLGIASSRAVKSSEVRQLQKISEIYAKYLSEALKSQYEQNPNQKASFVVLGKYASSEAFCVEVYLEKKVLYSHKPRGGVNLKTAYTLPFSMGGQNYKLVVRPTSQLLNSLNIIDSELVFFVFLTISILVSGLYYFLREARDMQHIISLQTAQLTNASKLMVLGEMASGIAHEINNPLAILTGKIHILKRELGDNISSTALHQLDRMETIIFRIAKVISSLKKLGYKPNEDIFESVDLVSLVEEVLESCDEKFKKDGVSLRVHPIPDVIIECNPVDIHQILSNLLNNSYDAVIGLEEKWIEIGFELKKNEIQIQVTDSGKGIPEHLQAKILQPFFTTKPVGMGMGIGLSISHNLARHNKGDLYLDKKHENTRFTLELPARKKEPEATL